MLMDILRLLVPILGVGSCVALITAWVQYRRAKTRAIPLIERVNRLVSSELKGFVLARFVPEGEGGHLEAVQRVREYQLTLRNTSPIHLHNAEIQFDFPSKEIEGLAERPARSKTTPTPIEVAKKISEPRQGASRWCIPEFPPDDSIEFTFRAVDPSTDDYEVALYNCGRVVIEKSKGEPKAKYTGFGAKISGVLASAFVLAYLAEIVIFVSNSASNPTVHQATVVDWAGCSLNVVTDAGQVNFKAFSQSGPWSLYSHILNLGTRKCFIKWESSSGYPITIYPGTSVTLVSEYTKEKPKLTPVGLLFGPDGPNNKATVMLYQRGKP